MHVSHRRADLSPQNCCSEASEECRQVCSENRGVQLVECSLCFAEDIRQEVTSGSLTEPSSRRYRSCVHRELPLRSSRSVVFLDKSLSISLVDLEGRRAPEPTSFTSTLSVRFGASSWHRLADNKAASTPGPEHRRGPGSPAGHGRGLLAKQRGHGVTQTAPTRGVNRKPPDSHARRHSGALGLLSFRGPGPSHTKAGRQKGNADEAALATRSNFTHRQHTFNTGPVDSRTRGGQPAGVKAQGGGGGGGRGGGGDCERTLSTEAPRASASVRTCCSHPRPKDDSLDGAPVILSLKEALELYRPDFISRSQRRVRRLEQRARRRRALQGCSPDLVQGLREDGGRQRRKCTTPDPLSDNLFKPRERSISGGEMQRRSRRIYNKLPEVTKKKEEEKKRAESQTNRLRADVFKKRLLDRILQR